MRINAIETQYKGYRFRSRLEARWATFFDALNLEWQYENEGFDLGQELGWYLPDFYLPKFNTWAEVKPETPEFGSLEFKKLFELTVSSPKPAIGVFLTQIEKAPTVINDYEWLDGRVPVWREMDGKGLLTIDHEDQRIRCPICLCDWVHFETAINIDGKDNYASGRGVRGNVIAIPAWCETGGHKWEIDFGFHKGQTFVNIRNIQERLDNFALILAGGNDSLLKQAITKAKSARFEHGESPVIPGEYSFL